LRHKPETVGNARVADGHIGLVSRRKRAEMLGGTFEIEAKAGNGTNVPRPLISRPGRAR